MTVLPASFYQRSNVVDIAKDLLGKLLVSTTEGGYCAGIITETEAYHQSEKACHAYQGLRTKRTECLFHEGGQAYVYLCYGIHHLFNVTTGNNKEASAVLIRAIEPHSGVEAMLLRRKSKKITNNLTTGPGKLTQALGISVKHTAQVFSSDLGIWIEESPAEYVKQAIACGPRIGVAYAEEDALLPWRFWLKNSRWVSK